jgi:hypothetical protein
MVDAWRPLAPMSVALGHPEFPPMSMVYVLSGEAGWPLSMLRAAAALRLFHTIYIDPTLVNGICQFLTFADQQVSAPPPTNNPDGWEAYREVFRAVRRDCDPAGTVPPLLLRPDAAPLHPDEANAFGEAIPDLSSGFPALADVLAALEWRATLLPWLEEGSLGDMILIDLRGVDQAVWESHPDFSLARGLAVMRAPPRPIWLMQSAGQRVDDWGLPHDRPIFTEHSEHQFAWMTFQGHLAPSWPAGYADRCGLQLSAELLRRCRQTADRDS